MNELKPTIKVVTIAEIAKRPSRTQTTIRPSRFAAGKKYCELWTSIRRCCNLIASNFTQKLYLDENKLFILSLILFFTFNLTCEAVWKWHPLVENTLKMTHYRVILASDFIPQVLEVITNPERHSRSHLSSLDRHKMKTRKKPETRKYYGRNTRKRSRKIAF